MRNFFRIYVLLFIGVSVFFQYGKPHPDYFIACVAGFAVSWLAPGLLLDYLLGHNYNMPEVLGVSFAFWLVVGLLLKAYRTKAKGKPSRAGLAVAESPCAESPYIALPNLPPEYGYYPKPSTHTTRTVRYFEER